MDVEAQEAEISLLDLLVVVAENIKLLLLGPLLAGLVALGIGYALPQNYVSQAILLLPSTNSTNSTNSAQAAAMMTSPLVLDPIIATDPELNAKPIETARIALAGKLKAAVAKDGLLRLEATASQPQAAQALANAVIDNWLKSTVPGPQDRADLEKRLSYASNALASVTTLLNTLSVDGAVSLGKPLTRGEAGTSLVGLGELQTRYLNDVLAIPRSLQGLSRDVVKQPPTLPTEPVSNKKALIAVMSTLGAGFALLLFVFMRQAWRNASQDPETAPKMARLRAAFGARKA
ncbi:MAG: Wzz/FepE/Etk N-terminal domain-containing protein [Rhodoferax sp.]|uniref:Wzz/FepE/Etk N-terminal domain-containing protein n=1 Tax=Rhodoferax sp. TaxID=50421 RepID=UPI0027317FE7|nr:Wzz/FepE/Etk N-terminal domain-containing protein [Rhodoferax sp.]MDP1529072.1 Wzz/FepE/Etk N-terminal domain-containing protein [Rhodoferax sp.]MDP1945536.1 Wzz/FepE/Etk N-terminal domain-containing protein [Rhodoferax sp.]